MEAWSTWLLTTLLGVIGIYYAVWRQMNYFKRKGIPYVESIPFLGNMASTAFRRSSIADSIKYLYNLKPDVKYFGMFDFVTPVLLIRDPELIKSVAIKNFESFQDHKNILNSDLDPLFTKNLFFLQGERWRDIRTLLSPSFTSSKMKMMFKLVSKCGADLADYLADAAVESKPIELKDTFTRYTSDVIATSAFGLSVNSLKEKDNEFYTMGRKATTFDGIKTTKLFLLRCIPQFAKVFNLRVIEEHVANFFSHVISSNITSRKSQGIVRNDMIQLMLQANEKSEKLNLSVEEMTAQAFIFFFAGFDTASTLMCFAAHEIGVNPDVQKKLQEEIDAVLAEGDGELSYEALHGMQYLDMVVNEALRLYPPVSTIDRVCNKAFELPPAAPGLAPVTVDVGSVIWFPFHGLHRDPAYFPEPDKFDPERFSEINKSKITGYFPFGVGPRSCIGNRFALMEAKLALFYLLAKFELYQSEKTCVPMEFDRSNFNITAKNGFWLNIRKRQLY